MRLLHEELIDKLPRQQLLGQHRECCALRGSGWGRKHSVVDYVFRYSPERLVMYHMLVMDEMESRGYHPNNKWRNPYFRGLSTPPWSDKQLFEKSVVPMTRVYFEHDSRYLKECIENLRKKNIVIRGMK